jgi:polyhydroxybutyrate depolymerase
MKTSFKSIRTRRPVDADPRLVMAKTAPSDPVSIRDEHNDRGSRAMSCLKSCLRVGVLLSLSLSSGCMMWRPQWPDLQVDISTNGVSSLLREAEQKCRVAVSAESVESAVAAYQGVVALEPLNFEANIALSHLHLLLGDGYVEKRSEKHADFLKAMRYAEAAMFINPAFRNHIKEGRPTWVACEALGEREMDAMFFWVNAVFYMFKEARWAPGQALNYRWIKRARRVMEQMTAIRPDGKDPLLDFVWGTYYLSIPESVGGDREKAIEYFDAAVDNAPDRLLPRWGRAKYYHVKMKNLKAFREDLEWVLAHEAEGTADHPAWRAFFIRDARRLLDQMDCTFDYRTGKYRRHAVEHIPSSYDATQPMPLVLVLHGAFSTAKQMDHWAEWSSLADREGFIVVYPEGIGIWGFLQHWNAGHCCGKAVRDGWDDVAFIDALIDNLLDRHVVDERRIYMVGLSNGGMMTYRYAAERSSRLAAAAVVSGALGSRESPDAPEWCLPEPAEPVPMLVIHGTEDDSIPYEGGVAAKKNNGRTYLSVDDAVAFWARANQSKGTVESRLLFRGTVQEETGMNKDGKPAIRLCRIHGWGHQWPGGSITRSLPEDHALRGFDAASYIWDFFAGKSDAEHERSGDPQPLAKGCTSK